MGHPENNMVDSSASSAILSPCRKYRYVLERRWAKCGATIMFVGLNPSTADERVNDPTVRRCIGFAMDWGFSSLILVNLFAYRATNPKALLTVNDPVGAENDFWIDKFQKHAEVCVVAWGMHGSNLGRDAEVLKRIKNPTCFGTTMAGAPKHPLYLSSKTRLQKFRLNY